jgi:glycosyltransferase involved in cell wall biosynthesis
LEWGGSQVYSFALMKEAKKHCEVRAVIPQKSSSQMLYFLKSLEISPDFFNTHFNTEPANGFLGKIKLHLHKFQVEKTMLKRLFSLDLTDSVVHIDLAPWQSLISFIFLCFKANLVVTMHNSLPKPQKWREILWKLKFWIVTRFSNFKMFSANQEAKDNLKLYVPKDFWDTITVTRVGVKFDEIDKAISENIGREVIYKKHNFPKDKFVILCVGQFIDRKGRWLFLETAQEFVKKYDDTIFVWVTNSFITDADKERINSYQLGEKFRLIKSEDLGEHIDLFKFIRLADLFVLPSYLEGLPISILESMALEVATISTNITAIPEAIKHLDTGYLIEAGDKNGLFEAFETLKNDDDLRQKLAKQGREFIIKNFDERIGAKVAFEEYKKFFE